MLENAAFSDDYFYSFKEIQKVSCYHQVTLLIVIFLTKQAKISVFFADFQQFAGIPFQMALGCCAR